MTAARLVESQDCFDSGDYPHALTLLEHLHQTGTSAQILRGLAQVNTRLSRPAKALRYALEAVRKFPQDADAHFTLALLYLLHGNCEQGFTEYEWRLNRDVSMIVPEYAEGRQLWDGRPLESEPLLLHCEQGFGDNLQFIRFLPQLKERVKTIYLACHPELFRLFSKLEGLAGLVTEKQPIPSCEVHCPLLSLPHRLKVRLDNIPQAPYLFASSSSSEQFYKQNKPRVGLVWRAKLASPNGHYKSVTLKELLPLTTLPVEWISLQKDPDRAEKEMLQNHFHAQEMGGNFQDFLDTADGLSGLDYLITVDTSVAHLAGAMGVKTLLLLPKWPDWRWLLDRSKSPWYPNMTLFRQDKDRNWSHAIDQLKASVQKHIST